MILQAVEARMIEIEKSGRQARLGGQLPDTIPSSSTFVVGIMCEEGKHRSVAFAEELAREIKVGKNWVVSVEHRDLGLVSSNDQDHDSNAESSDVKPGRKSKKQREQERKKGRSSARNFHVHSLGDEALE